MITIGVLGPKKSFSEKAAKQWAEKSISRNEQYKIEYFDDIPSIIAAIIKGEITFAVIPTENSLEGSITITLDLLMEHEELKIVGEWVLQIVHCFLANKRGIPIKKIASHQQAINQCRNYLQLYHKGIETVPMNSTSAAAAKASKSKSIAAIASREAAAEYDLDIIDENIQDNSVNFTRFIVIGNYYPAITGNDKTSIIVWPKENKAGALYEILGVFAEKEIDLIKIESRTTKKTLGDYLFHIDIKGHMEDKIIAEALKELKRKAGILKNLGSYPIAKVNGEV